jgi:hypothetical protein
MQKNLTQELKECSLNLSKTLTSPLNNGGAITFQIQDVVEYIQHTNPSKEKEFLKHLLRKDNLTQEKLESFFKHMLFKKENAQKFIQWQRSLFKQE